jgi:transcriptional regulator with XRE-family HTH domain
MGSPVINDPVTRHTLAQNLRAELNKREWSEAELARRTGISQKQINNIIRERNGCSIEALVHIGRALQMPHWWLTMPGATESAALPNRAERLMHAYASSAGKERAALDKILDEIERRERAAR